MSAPLAYGPERELVAQACRVLIARGLVDGLLGHVSVRVDEGRLLVRCRAHTNRVSRTPPPTTSGW